MASYYCILASSIAWVFIFALLLLVTIAIRRWRKMCNVKLAKLEWRHDVVYLVQFPPVPDIGNISPFCLKLETWLRMRGVPYENVYAVRFSRNGQAPFVELNGEQLPDSNGVIRKLDSWLKGKSGQSASDMVTATENAITHAFTAMMESQTCLASFYWRYGLHMKEFFAKLVYPYFPPSVGICLFFRHLEPIMVKIRCYLHGISRQSEDDFMAQAEHDLISLSTFLGDKSYFLGHDYPTTLDCTMFGHLVQFVYLPMAIPQKDFILKQCPNLVNFCDRMRDKLWPDWQKLGKAKSK